jgi:hypothetical protein
MNVRILSPMQNAKLHALEVLNAGIPAPYLSTSWFWEKSETNSPIRVSTIDTSATTPYISHHGTKPANQTSKDLEMFALETGVPVPPRATFGQKRGSKYPFADMEVGNSFLVPEGIKSQTIRSAIGAFNKTNKDRKFAVRVTDAGTRVWRTE